MRKAMRPQRILCSVADVADDVADDDDEEDDDFDDVGDDDVDDDFFTCPLPMAHDDADAIVMKFSHTADLAFC